MGVTIEDWMSVNESNVDADISVEVQGSISTVDGKLVYSLDEMSNSWRNGQAEDYMVRGASYLDDKVKIHSQNSLMKVKDAFGIRILGGEDPDVIVRDIVNANTSPSDICLIVHFNIDPEHLILIFTPDHDNIPTGPSYTCLERFLNGDSGYRNDRLKLIPFIHEGPWVARKAVGGKKPVPAIIGKKLKNYWEDDSNNKIILHCPVNSSRAAKPILAIVKKASKSIVIDLCLVIEAAEQDELPEQVLGVVQMSKIDLDSFNEFPKDI